MIAAGGSHGHPYQQFKRGLPGSAEHELFTRYIAPDVAGSTFAAELDGLKELLRTTENAALFAILEGLLVHEEYACQYLVPWISQYPE